MVKKLTQNCILIPTTNRCKTSRENTIGFGDESQNSYDDAELKRFL